MGEAGFSMDYDEQKSGWRIALEIHGQTFYGLGRAEGF
jgi:hypothetical protein